MDALSEMEKSVNSKIKSAVQSVKVWSPETIVSPGNADIPKEKNSYSFFSWQGPKPWSTE